MLKSGWYNIRVLKESNRQVLLDYNFYSEDHESANPIISFCMFSDFSKLVYVSMINDDSLSTIIFEQEPNKETRFYPQKVEELTLIWFNYPNLFIVKGNIELIIYSFMKD